MAGWVTAELPGVGALLLYITNQGQESGAVEGATLYIAARQSHHRRKGTAQEAVQCRPNARICEVEGTHFDVLHSSAQEIASLVTEFFRTS